jgi:hypothetical protein
MPQPVADYFELTYDESGDETVVDDGWMWLSLAGSDSLLSGEIGYRDSNFYANGMEMYWPIDNF